jgi:hypothetical protein
VIEDCNKALEYNARYTKALFRRAKACETENELSQSLEGKVVYVVSGLEFSGRFIPAHSMTLLYDIITFCALSIRDTFVCNRDTDLWEIIRIVLISPFHWSSIHQVHLSDVKDTRF